MRNFLPLMGWLLLAGCSTTLEAEDYDRSCREDAECVAVLVGDICDCSCQFGAISAAELDAYNEDRASISCSNDCGPCPEAPAVACSDNLCAVP